MLELGPDERALPRASSASTRARPASTLLVTVGPLAAAIAERFEGEIAHASPTPPRRRALVPGAARARRHRAGQGLARRRARARLPSADGDRRGARPLMGSVSGRVLIAGTASLLMCLFLSPKFIEFLRRREFGQNIREEGPEGHQTKAGTPTMGGIIIFIAFAVPFLILSTRDWQSIGVFGGDARVRAARASPTTTRRSSSAARSACARGRSSWSRSRSRSGCGGSRPRRRDCRRAVRLRFVDVSVDLGPLYPVFIYLVVAGTTSAVNLTDGLDGLAAGCAAIVLLAYIGITFITTGQRDLTLLAACLVGACIGFLWFNSFPASIFMGDTGSLGLGGAIAGLAVMTKTEVLLILLGGIFVIEALSVADPGVLVPDVSQARVPDGADPPPLRAAGLVGDEDHPALLDRRRRLRRDRLHGVPAEHPWLSALSRGRRFRRARIWSSGWPARASPPRSRCAPAGRR